MISFLYWSSIFKISINSHRFGGNKDFLFDVQYPSISQILIFKTENMIMANYVTSTSDKSKTTALILCIFLGLFGAHYFYVGRYGRGFLYMFTAGLFVIGWILDIIKIMNGTFVDNVGAPLRA